MSRAVAVLVWFAFVPLIRSCLESSPRYAFYKGWAVGTAVYVAILYWIVPTFNAAGQSLWLSIPALLALAAYVGLYWGLWTWGLTRIMHLNAPLGQTPLKVVHHDVLKTFNPVLFSVFGAASWVVLEWLRGWLFSGFPWATLSDSQAHVLPLIQIASMTGAYGISFLIILVNISTALSLDKIYKPLAVAGLLLLFSVGYGSWQLHRPSTPPAHDRALRVALLQGNVDQYKKWDDVYVDEIKKTYETLTRRATEEKAQLIIWPETSVPGYLLQQTMLRLWLTKTIWASHAYHIVGSPSVEGDRTLNSAFAIHPTGYILSEYDKQHLVPFGEVVPFQFLLGRWISVLNALGGFMAGTRSPVMHAAGVSLGVSICYEAIFPNLVRKSVKSGAQILVNITNDGWYMKTAAPYQHLAPNIYRAVENRRWLLRANNTGVSAIIDPYGRLIAQTPIYIARVITGEVAPLDEKTFYTRFGNVFVLFCIGFTVAVLIRRGRLAQ